MQTAGNSIPLNSCIVEQLQSQYCSENELEVYWTSVRGGIQFGSGWTINCSLEHFRREKTPRI